MPSTEDPLATARSLLLDRQRCPGCRAVLAGPVCPTCGLDLRGPRGEELWRASVASAAALDARQEMLAALYRVAPQPSAVPRGPVMPTPAAGRPMPPAPRPDAPVGAPRAVVASAPRRAWTVQTVLQVLGAGLLAAACIVFLVVAWGSFPLAVRAGVIVVATVLVFALASWLRGRALPQGAEAVAALAVVLLLLDAWAARRTGLLHGGPGWGYWALAFLVCAGALAGWGRVSRLTTGRVAAAVLWLAAPVPLVAWHPAPGTGFWVPLLVVAAAAARFVPRRVTGDGPRRRPELLVLTTGGVMAGALAGGWALVLATVDHHGPMPAARLGVLAVVCAATALLARRTDPTGWDRPTTPGWAVAAGVAAAASAAAAGAGALPPRADELFTLAAAAAAAALLAAVVGALGAVDETADRAVTGAQAATGVLVGTASLAVAVLVAEALAAPTRSGASHLAAVSGAVAAGALAAGVTGARRAWLGATRLGIALAVTAVVAFGLAVSVAGPRPWLPTLTLLALASAFVAVDLLLSRTTATAGNGSGRLWRDGARGGSVAAAGLALGAAAPDRAAAGVALVGLAALTLTARAWRRDAPALTTVGGAVLATGGAGLLLAAAGLDDVSATAGAAAAADVTLGVVAFAAPRAMRDERRTAFGGAVALAALGWTVGASSAVSATALPVGAALLLVAATAWRGADRIAPAAVTQAVGVAAPVAALVAPTLRAVAWPGLSVAGVVLLAAVLGAVGALLAPWVAERTTAEARLAAEVGGGVALAGAFATAWAAGPDVAALVLLVAAVAALGVARTADRALLRWVGLALGAVASWVLLGARDVPVAEAYLAPAGAVLALVGARRARRAAEGDLGLLGAGLALVLLPSAVLPGSVPLGSARLDRLWITCVAAGLLVAPPLVIALLRGTTGGRWQPLWLLTAAGAGLAVLGPFRHAVTVALGRPTRPPLAPELWSLVAVVVLGAAAVVVRRGPRPEPASWWPACLVPALAAAAIPSVLAAAPGALGWLRVVVVFAVAGAAAAAAQRTLLTAGAGRRGLRVAPVVGAAIAAFASLVAAARLHDVPGDVPLVALGALASVLGVQWLAARPGGGTWPALVAGATGMLVVPTVVSLGDAAAWRPLYLVLVGVASVAAGAVLRWQAPFVIGAGVLVVVIASYAGPWAGQVLSATGSWPLLAAGGAILLALGITYERRLAQAKEAARFVAAMR